MAARRRGFTYLGVLFLVALLSLTAAMAAVVWSTEQRRENERELLFAGRQFAAAIERYRQQAIGQDARYPQRLEDLLKDPRSLATRRFLRQLYPDPMTGEARWGLLRLPDGGIVGVHSLSSQKPIGAGPARSAAATRYRDWRFVAPSAAELQLAGSVDAG